MIEISNEAHAEIQKVVKESGEEDKKIVRIYVAGHG